MHVHLEILGENELRVLLHFNKGCPLFFFFFSFLKFDFLFSQYAYLFCPRGNSGKQENDFDGMVESDVSRR